MTISDLSDFLEPAQGDEARYYGVTVGIITNNKDPEKLGRCKLHFPWLHEESDESDWARIIYPMAGAGMGFWFIPEIDDEVLVGFEHGNVRFPYIVGTLYNGIDLPPGLGEPGQQDFNEDGENNLRAVKSRCGHKLLFDDGGSAVKLEDKKGNIVHLNSDENSIFQTANRDISITACAGDVIIKAANDVNVEAGENIERQAGADVKLNSGAATKITAGSTYDQTSTGAMSIKSGATLDMSSSSNMNIGTGATMSVSSGSKMTFGASGKGSISSTGNMTVGAGVELTVASTGDANVGSEATLTIGSGAIFKVGSDAETTFASKSACAITAAAVMAIGAGGILKNSAPGLSKN